MQIAALEDWHVRKDFLDWGGKVAETSGLREADNRLSAISAMLTWAVKKHRLSKNHLRGFTRLYESDRSEIIWRPEHIEAFRKAAPVELQRALLLALHTGRREGDLLNLPWLAYKGGKITLRQRKSRRGRKKRGRKIVIPCSGDLRLMLDKMPRVSPFILTTKTGQRFKKRHFLKEWNCAMVEAGLERVVFPDMDEPVELHFHDLRGTAVTMLAEAGCTVPEIVAIT
jgi:integrase